MAEEKEYQGLCCSGDEDKPGCQIDAVVTIDTRGQIILPKEVRQKAGMKAGDKFAVISCESDGNVCCIVLVNTNKYANTTQKLIGPLFKSPNE